MNQPTEPEFLDDGGLKKPDRSTSLRESRRSRSITVKSLLVINRFTSPWV